MSASIAATTWASLARPWLSPGIVASAVKTYGAATETIAKMSVNILLHILQCIFLRITFAGPRKKFAGVGGLHCGAGLFHLPVPQ